MDQPYSRMADMMLDKQYYNVSDPRPYDDTGWTLGALRNVKTMRITDSGILKNAMTFPTRLERYSRSTLIYSNKMCEALQALASLRTARYGCSSSQRTATCWAFYRPQSSCLRRSQQKETAGC